MKKLYDAVDSAMQALSALPMTGDVAVDLSRPITPLFRVIQNLRETPELAVDYAREACEDLANYAVKAEAAGRAEHAAEARRIGRELSPVVAAYITRYLLAPPAPVAE